MILTKIPPGLVVSYAGQIGSFPQVTDENLKKLKPPPRKSEKLLVGFGLASSQECSSFSSSECFSRPGSISLQPPYHSF